MGNITEAQKDELANSNEIQNLHQAISGVQTAALGAIQRAIDEGYTMLNLKNLAIGITQRLQNEEMNLNDGNGNCPPGQHWDKVARACVPD